MQNVLVVDYGMGNLKSVQRAFEKVGANVNISNSPDELMDADKVILPGVGSFGRGMKKLEELKLDSALKNFAQTGKPLMGICLGMQLLFETSVEFGNQKGLAVLGGDVKEIPRQTPSGQWLRVPNVGWCNVQNFLASETDNPNKSEKESSFYFTHSFSAVPSETKIIDSVLDYNGYKIVASVKSRNIFGVQFHPEKSGQAGLEILAKFLLESESW